MPGLGSSRRAHGRERRRQLGADHDQARRRNPDRMQQRVPRKMRVEQRHRHADARKPEPHRHIFGAVRHQQRRHIARLKALREAPVRILVAARRELPVTERALARHQRRRGAELLRLPVDQQRQGQACVRLDLGGSLERPQPRLAREFRVPLVRFTHGCRRAAPPPPSPPPSSRAPRPCECWRSRSGAHRARRRPCPRARPAPSPP